MLKMLPEMMRLLQPMLLESGLGNSKDLEGSVSLQVLTGGNAE